jgi:hypothetical protein
MSVARHEASHAACAILLGRRVEHTWREIGLTQPGDTVGQARIPVGEQIEMSQLAICLIGYMSENEPGWPPDYEDACGERREALGKVIHLLEVNREAYEACVEIVRDMLADTDLFIPLRDAIERALGVVPRLEAEDIEALAAIHLQEQEAA